MSDLTPEETLRRSVHRETPDGGDVSLQDALAAVAAERERIVKLLRDEAADGAWVGIADAVLRVVGERLLSDEVVEAVAMTYEPDSFVGDAPHADEALRDARDVLSAAWRVVTGSNHE